MLAEVELTISAGVAATKLDAKIASDLRKPDGLVVVPPGTEAAFLAPLEIARLWCVGPKTQAVLAEFGVTLRDDVEVRVWDSSAEVRYLVLPERPAGTDGLSEDELAALVPRDAMIGTAFAAAPAQG